jgi:flagellar M-ring protein FliF
VVNLRFAETPALKVGDSGGLLAMLQFTKEDIMRAVELAVMGILGVVVVLVVVRPLIRRIIEPDQALPAREIAVLAGSLAAHGNERSDSANTGKIAEIAGTGGKVRADAIKQVAELADKNPNETAAIIREWLSEPVSR